MRGCRFKPEELIRVFQTDAVLQGDGSKKRCKWQLCAQYASFRLAWDGTKRGHTIPELVGTLEIR